MSAEQPKEAAPFDASDRTLCEDPACIGVVAQDGRCGDCGRRGPQDAQAVSHPGQTGLDAVLEKPNGEDGEGEDDEGEDDEGKDDEGEDDEGEDDLCDQDEADAEFENRRLCPEPSCIGVLSHEGRCGLCGRHTEKT